MKHFGLSTSCLQANLATIFFFGGGGGESGLISCSLSDVSTIYSAKYIKVVDCLITSFRDCVKTVLVSLFI